MPWTHLPFALSVELLLLVAHAACDDGDAKCRVGGSDAEAPCTSEDQGGAQVGSRSWRSLPYIKPTERVYGGQYVVEAFRKHFAGPVLGDDWDVLWTQNFQVGELIQRNLPPRAGRLVNHCRYFRGAGQKCYFAGHIRRVAQALSSDPAKSVHFTHLRNYVLNHNEQLSQWRRDVQAHPEQPWILKKCSAGMSAGVELVQGDQLLSKADRWAKRGKKSSEEFPWTVAQEYLHRPFLGFGGSKFHLRVYVLVTRWGPPPGVLVFNEGVIFRSRHQYEHDNLSKKRDIFSSIAPGVEALPHSALWEALDAGAGSHGPKGPLPGSVEVRARMIFVIRSIFGEALQASFGDAINETRPEEVGFACFDLFGLDVMFDEELQPFVLEVNRGPNLEIDDRGEESTGLLLGVKAPLIAQVVRWAGLYVDKAPTAAADARAIENEALVNFTRVL